MFLAVTSYITIMINNPVSIAFLFAQNPAMLIPTFILMFFIGGGNEELGWRGYAFAI